MNSKVNALVFDIREGRVLQIAHEVRRYPEDPANLIHLKLAGFQKLCFIVRDGNRLKLHAFFQYGHPVAVGRSAVGTVPAFPECLWVLHGVRVRQDAGRPSTIGEELTAVFLGSDPKADGVFLQRNWAVSHNTVKPKTGNVQNIPGLDRHCLTITGGVGVGQVSLAVTIHIHVVWEQRIQANDLILSTADDLAVTVAV